MNLFPDHAQQIQDLAQRLDRLLEATARVVAENAALRQQLEQLRSEHHTLHGRNTLARQRVESMLGRLNDMERNDDP